MASSRISAGLLMFRRKGEGLDVFLVHPGGPLFARKDAGVWTIPKGEASPEEDLLAVALREFEEETGQTVEACGRGPMLELGSVVQRGGKRVHAWGFEGEWPAGAELASNTFTMEWPPHSGTQRQFPEADRGAFFPVDEARAKINPAQAELIDRLIAQLG